MLGIKTVEHKDLIDVDFLCELKSDDTIIRDVINNNLVNFGYRGGVTLYTVMGLESIDLVGGFVKRGEKVVALLEDEDYIKHRLVINFSEFKTGCHSSYTDNILGAVEEKYEDLFNKDTTYFADCVYKFIKNILKPNKQNEVTINRCIAFGRIKYRTVEEYSIKRLKTALNSVFKPLYVYTTDKHIENHYSLISETQRLTSCMTKGYDILTHNNFVEFNENSDLQGRRTTSVENTDNKEVVFTANVEGYNNCDDFRLGLVSKLSPDELKNSTSYPFIARLILTKDNSGIFNTYASIYGDETVKNAINSSDKLISSRTNTLEKRLKAYISFYGRGFNGLKEQYILPYLDGAYNVFSVGDEIHYDDIGRPYRWATVQKHHKYSIDSYPFVSDESVGLHYLDQDIWVTTEYSWVDFEPICPITKERLDNYNGCHNKYLGYVHVKYKDYVPDEVAHKAIQYYISKKDSEANLSVMADELRLFRYSVEKLLFNNKIPEFGRFIRVLEEDLDIPEKLRISGPIDYAFKRIIEEIPNNFIFNEIDSYLYLAFNLNRFLIKTKSFSPIIGLENEVKISDLKELYAELEYLLYVVERKMSDARTTRIEIMSFVRDIISLLWLFKYMLSDEFNLCNYERQAQNIFKHVSFLDNYFNLIGE